VRGFFAHPYQKKYMEKEAEKSRAEQRKREREGAKIAEIKQEREREYIKEKSRASCTAGFRPCGVGRGGRNFV
jgi:hypothetical protein